MASKDTAIAAIMEQLMAEGPQAMAPVVTALMNLAMQMEREQFLGAGHYERSSGRRGYANGAKLKKIDTPAGTLTLEVPKTAGTQKPFFPQSLERGRRACRAVMLIVATGAGVGEPFASIRRSYTKADLDRYATVDAGSIFGHVRFDQRFQCHLPIAAHDPNIDFALFEYQLAKLLKKPVYYSLIAYGRDNLQSVPGAPLVRAQSDWGRQISRKPRIHFWRYACPQKGGSGERWTIRLRLDFGYRKHPGRERGTWFRAVSTLAGRCGEGHERTTV